MDHWENVPNSNFNGENVSGEWSPELHAVVVEIDKAEVKLGVIDVFRFLSS